MTTQTKDTLAETLAATGYVADDGLAMALLLTEMLNRPLLLEGEAGVGKTEVAKSLAKLDNTDLIRLQCYEGLDRSDAIYEWNYQRQLLTIRAAAEDGETGKSVEERIFSRDFLLERPLLAAITQDTSPVLLIDEIDRADEEFEAYLLEVLSDYQVTVPEIGTIRAQVPPLVILTSNNIRELGDALKRRCLHLHIDFPEAEREQAIVRARVPDVSDALLKQLVEFVQGLRDLDIRKRPSISETVDWARTLLLMHATELDEDMVRSTLNVLLKHESDIQAVDKDVRTLARAAASTG